MQPGECRCDSSTYTDDKRIPMTSCESRILQRAWRRNTITNNVWFLPEGAPSGEAETSWTSVFRHDLFGPFLEQKRNEAGSSGNEIHFSETRNGSTEELQSRKCHSRAGFFEADLMAMLRRTPEGSPRSVWGPQGQLGDFKVNLVVSPPVTRCPPSGRQGKCISLPEDTAWFLS